VSLTRELAIARDLLTAPAPTRPVCAPG